MAPGNVGPRDAEYTVGVTMPKGVHARSGQAPDPNAARRDRKNDPSWTTLPLEGRGKRARAPKFPLDQETQFESTVWAMLWKKPQSVMWEKLGMLFQVAAYTRSYVESVLPGAPASLKTSVLRMEDTLGLSMTGMNMLRWRFAEDEVQGQRSTRSADVEDAPPVRRLRAS